MHLLALVLSVGVLALVLGVTLGPRMSTMLDGVFLVVGTIMLFVLGALETAFSRLDGVWSVDDGSLFGRPEARWWVLIPAPAIAAAVAATVLLLVMGGSAAIRRSYGRLPVPA